MWVLGGKSLNSYLNDVWSSEDGKTWTQITGAAGWAKRATFAVAVFNNKMWVLGGRSGSEVFNDVWWSADGKTWTMSTDTAKWPARAYHSSFAFDNKLWVLGGSDKNKIVTDNTSWYSEDGAHWSGVPNNNGWQARQRFATVIYKNKAWIIAGVNSQSELADVWYLDGQTGAGDQVYKSLQQDNLSVGGPDIRGAVQIRFRTELSTQVRIDIFNGSGKEITRVFCGYHTGGERTVAWNGLTSRGLPPSCGIYFVRLETGELSAARAIIRSGWVH